MTKTGLELVTFLPLPTLLESQVSHYACFSLSFGKITFVSELLDFDLLLLLVVVIFLQTMGHSPHSGDFLKHLQEIGGNGYLWRGARVPFDLCFYSSLFYSICTYSFGNIYTSL